VKWGGAGLRGVPASDGAARRVCCDSRECIKELNRVFDLAG
jgi:hypothetical protein